MLPFIVKGPLIHVDLLILILMLWSIVWKIYAAWIAAKNNHKKWFLALMVLNTAGILEIIYVFHVAKKSWTEVRADFHGAWGARKEVLKATDIHHDGHH